MTLSADRALTIRATLSRLTLALRADDRHLRACEIIERLTALGATVEISETHVTVTMPDDDGDPIIAVVRRHHTQWLLTLQVCISKLIERTHEQEGPTCPHTH